MSLPTRFADHAATDPTDRVLGRRLAHRPGTVFSGPGRRLPHDAGRDPGDRQLSRTLDDCARPGRRLTGNPGLVAVDPLPDEGPLARDESGKWSARALLDANLRASGRGGGNRVPPGCSYELAPQWDRPLRLLWIDGDHRYASTKQDFDLFSPFLADGAILAMHDVLSRYDGCIRVFTEDVLASPHFGASGLCGSIGWAQFWQDPARAQEYRRRNAQLRRGCSR